MRKTLTASQEAVQGLSRASHRGCSNPLSHSVACGVPTCDTDDACNVLWCACSRLILLVLDLYDTRKVKRDSSYLTYLSSSCTLLYLYKYILDIFI